MNRGFYYHNKLRAGLFVVIGLFLCSYFTYHAIQGHRSIPHLFVLYNQIGELETELEALKSEKAAVHHKVIRLRPATISADFLEERVREVLGFTYDNEMTVLLDRPL